GCLRVGVYGAYLLKLADLLDRIEVLRDKPHRLDRPLLQLGALDTAVLRSPTLHEIGTQQGALIGELLLILRRFAFERLVAGSQCLPRTKAPRVERFRGTHAVQCDLNVHRAVPTAVDAAGDRHTLGPI